MGKTVTIDAFPDSVYRHLSRSAIVCVDILAYTTVAVTAVARGRRVFMAADDREAEELRATVPGSLVLAGDSAWMSLEALDVPGDRSPVILTERPCSDLLTNCRDAEAVYVSCLRNSKATAAWLSSRYDDIAVIAAGQGFDFRCDDRLGAARLARELTTSGFSLLGQGAAQLVKYWGSADPGVIALGRSARDANRSGRSEDVRFVQSHVDDLDVVCRCRGNEILPAHVEPGTTNTQQGLGRSSTVVGESGR